MLPKMIYLLIDTCIWKKLVSTYEISPSLLQIEDWVNNGHVNLLCPEILKLEWRKHRELGFDSIRKSIERQKKSIALLADSNKVLLDKINEQNATNKLNAQVEIIDKLFENSTFIPESDNVMALTVKQQKAGKAPFIKKKDSRDDASIIFCSLEFIQTNKIGVLYFTSENFTDFGISRNGEYQIHPDLLDDFNECNIIYFTEINSLIAELKSKGLPTKAEPKKQEAKSVDFFLSPEVNKNQNIIDQIYHFLKERFSVFQTLPHSIWANKYPFKSSKKAYFEYDLFCLFTDNRELFTFFESLNIIENNKIEFTNRQIVEGVINCMEKTHFILSSLNDNLVFDIELQGENKRKDIRYFKPQNLNSPDNYLINLQLDKALQSLTAISENDELKEEIAFLNYELGNYNQSARLYLKLLEKEDESNGSNSKIFLYQYNLSKLEPFVKYRYSEEKPDALLVENLKTVRNKFESDSTVFYNDPKLTKWLKEGYFLRDRQETLLGDIVRLRDFFYMLQNGGRGSNSIIWSIYVTHALFLSFLNDNRIVNEFGFETAHLNEIFTESIIMSYGIHHSMYSKLETFDDWIIKALILYSKPDSIIKYCNRYSVKSIKYQHNSLADDGFMSLTRNFFNSNEYVIKYLESTPNYYLTDKFRRIFGNLLTLASFLELSENNDREFASLLYNFFIKPSTINYRFEVKSVNRFIIKKGKIIGKGIVENYFNLIFSSSYFHDEDFLYSFMVYCDNEKDGIELTPEALNIIYTFFDDNCPLCNHKHELSMLSYFYRIAKNPDAKDSIKTKIVEKLTQKFDWRLYYQSAIYDILDTNNDFFNQLINIQKPKVPQSFLGGQYSKDEKNRDHRLNAIINICFKYNIKMSNENFSHLKGFDFYYDWLIDMENFDYTNFNPRWVSEHPTKYYFERIAQVEIVRQKIYDYLNKIEDPLLTKHYLEIMTLANAYKK